MSFFGLFGKKKEPVDTPHSAIQKLKETEAMLVKKQDYLDNKIQNEVAAAKKYAASNNKRMALQVCQFSYF
jgi:hypothetical protein